MNLIFFFTDTFMSTSTEDERLKKIVHVKVREEEKKSQGIKRLFQLKRKLEMD